MNLTPRISSKEYISSQPSAKRRNKYGARKVTADGITFDSRGERDRYEDLRLMQLAGEISDLRVHVRIPLLGAGDRPVLYPSGRQAVYEADYTYIPRGSVLVTIEDHKGMDTPASKLKRAVVEAMYGRPVLVTRKKARAA